MDDLAEQWPTFFQAKANTLEVNFKLFKSLKIINKQAPSSLRAYFKTALVFFAGAVLGMAMLVILITFCRSLRPLCTIEPISTGDEASPPPPYTTVVTTATDATPRTSLPTTSLRATPPPTYLTATTFEAATAIDGGAEDFVNGTRQLSRRERREIDMLCKFKIYKNSTLF